MKIIDLKDIPGIGNRIKEDLVGIGITNPLQLKNANPEILYLTLCEKQGMQIDRCMLYVMRCAVYCMSNKNPNPELLKWWNWKDSNFKKIEKYL